MGKRNRVKARNKPPLTVADGLRVWDNAPTTYFGTVTVGGEPAVDYEQRRNRCYELSTAALTHGDAPSGSVLVHGTWQGPGVTSPIGHGWVVLPDKQVWEPISCRIVPADVWAIVARPVAEATYTKAQAAAKIVVHRTWGCWHASAGLVANPELLPTTTDGDTTA